MKDKFRANIAIVLPAAIIALTLYFVVGLELPAVRPSGEEGSFLLTLPYLLVLVAAVAGMNVLGVLTLGIIACGAVGLGTGTLPAWDWIAALGSGITGMGELIIVTLMAGGVLELIRYNGGIDYLLRHLTRGISGKRGAELTIAILVSVANLCTANNTIAILTTGKVSREITKQYGLDPRKTASILDTFSCFVQGVIPYGAQLLLARARRCVAYGHRPQPLLSLHHGWLRTALDPPALPTPLLPLTRHAYHRAIPYTLGTRAPSTSATDL